MNIFFEKSIKPKKKFEILGIYTAIDKICDSEFDFTGESHPFWEFLYVKEGTVKVIEEENTYVLCEGAMICHAPGEFHRIKSVGGTSAHIYVLTVEHKGELPESIGKGVFELSLDMREQYEKCFAQLYYMCSEKGRNRSNHDLLCSSNASASFKETGNPNRIGQEGLSRLTVFLLTLSHLNANETMVFTSQRAQEYGKIALTMQRTVCDALSIDDFAAMHHVSKSYITKLFKSYAGEGPMKYYSRLRLSKIQKLLLDGISLPEIVDIMNFSSLAYLCAFFKNKCGVSAIEWLNTTRAMSI